MRNLATLLLALAAGIFPLRANTEEKVEQFNPIGIERRIDFNSVQNENQKSLDISFPLKNSQLEFNLEQENNDIKEIGIVGAIKDFYVGISYKDLETTNFLKDSDMLKIQMGLRPFDGLELALTGARIKIPDVHYSERYNISSTLTGIVYDMIVSPFINQKISPKFSAKVSLFLGEPEQSEDLEKLHKVHNDEDYTISCAFNHFKFGAGATFHFQDFDLELENFLNGNFFAFNNTNHSLGIKFDDGRNMFVYKFGVDIKPSVYEDSTPWKFDLKSDFAGFLQLPKGLYIKTNGNINYSDLKESDFILSTGISKNNKEFEVFYNSRTKSVGLMLSTRLEKISNKEKYLSKKHEIFERANPDRTYNEYVPWGNTDLIRSVWGENLEQVVSKIKNYQDLCNYISYIKQIEHPGIFTAEETHEKGYGQCSDINGRLIPYIISRALGDEAWGFGFTGPYIAHAVTIIKDRNGKYDLMDYYNYYNLDADTEWEAVQKVYPGFNTNERGEATFSTQTIIDSLEERMHEF